LEEAIVSTINVVCFSHVGITVRDLDASLEFYGRLFGFERLFDDVHDDWRRVGLRIADVQLELFSPAPSREPGSGVDPYYSMSFGAPKLALTVDDVDATYDRLEQAGVHPLCPVQLTPRSKFFFIADPDGTPIQLHQFLGGELRVTDLHATARQVGRSRDSDSEGY
jgi:catechol 2,3-dioxygenase-like lactoylglutathione lyase family enzyme